MTYDELKDYLEKKVVVTADNGNVFEGIFTNTESEFDTSSGEEEIEIWGEEVSWGIPFSAIKGIKLAEE